MRQWVLQKEVEGSRKQNVASVGSRCQVVVRADRGIQHGEFYIFIIFRGGQNRPNVVTISTVTQAITCRKYILFKMTMVASSRIGSK